MAEASDPAEGETILDDLRRRLAGVPVKLIATYLAERMGCDKTGRFRIEYHFEEGRVQRPFLHRGPIRNDELEELG